MPRVPHPFTAACVIATAALLPTPSYADFSLGMGAQYGGFFGVEYDWRFTDHIISAGMGTLFLGIGTSVSLKWLMNDHATSSLGVALHPVFSIDNTDDGDLESDGVPVVSVSYNWHPHAFASSGFEAGMSLLVNTSPGYDDGRLLPVFNIGYRF